MQAEDSTAAQTHPSEPCEPHGFRGEVAPASNGLASLAEEWSHDSAWTWLQPLSEMLGEISLPEDQGNRAVKYYRLLIAVNAELAKSLLTVRSLLAHSDIDLPIPRKRYGAGLTRWQVRRAQDFLAAHISATTSVGQVAAACGLSRAHFSSAFRQATGETPYLCLIRLRVERAKTLLKGPLTVSAVAQECGFADQSHLTRVFSKHTGVSPGVWRRERRCIEATVRVLQAHQSR